MVLLKFQIEYSLAAFHDAVILYAHALNETLKEGGDIMNGLSVVDKLRNRDFYLHYGMYRSRYQDVTENRESIDSNVYGWPSNKTAVRL